MGTYSKRRKTIYALYFVPPNSDHRVEVLRAQFKQRGEGLREVLEENLLIVGVEVNILAEAGILQKRDVRREHHELLRIRVAVLKILASFPFDAALLPLGILEELEVQIVERRRRRGPWSHKARGICVATAKGMSSAEGDDLLVIETHAVEDIPQMANVLLGGAVGRVGQPAVGSHITGAHGINTSGTPRDVRATQRLDGGHTSEGVEVSIADAGVGLLHRLEPRDCLVESRIATVCKLLLEADSSGARTSSL